MQHCLQEFMGSLLPRTLLTVPDQGVVGDPERLEASVLHCLQAFKGSLLQRTLLASTDQDAVGDPVWR